MINNCAVKRYISIHAPRERSDYLCKTSGFFCFRFQSTLLVRGATIDDFRLGAWKHISIHAPRERSDAYKGGFTFCNPISIHAPRERSDTAVKQ